MNFYETLLIACIPTLITAIISILVFRQQYVSFKHETMAERAVQQLLKHRTFTDRSFEVIKKNIGGWDNDEDELRKILVRAGAIRTFRDEKEWWTLLSRLDEKYQKKKTGK